ncbi:hypothetical protein [Parafannyhessea umbonata]|uniref:hypothetical protein n=1 Tax=Parafannyhessea umbonata TaxID=604330 RepID=UPI0026F014C1|nr:hypothetical protein [Parafannyhessea umbonata]MDD6601534.1 hypothetical protein [Parafannyhessea umbonata]
MSLRETINAAKREAQEANAPLAKKDEKDAADEDERSGFSKRSVTRAKPAREAASGVRVVGASGGGRTSSASGKTPVEMTKDEKKRARRERRDEADRRASASQIVLKQIPGYKRSQRVWWGLLSTGFVCTIISWLLPNLFPQQVNEGTTPMGVAVFIMLVAAYALIISAFVYDWRVVRPMRKKAEATTGAMTNKKVTKVLRGEANEIAREQAARDEAKAARRAKRSGRHEQHK